MGRPSDYTDATGKEICERLLCGESLISICKDGTMPHRVTVYRWMADRPDFATMFARAREGQADYMDDLILETANKSTVETAAADRVKLIAYTWRAARLMPSRFGDRVTVKNEGQGDVGAEPEAVAQENRDTWQHKHGNGHAPGTNGKAH